MYKKVKPLLIVSPIISNKIKHKCNNLQTVLEKDCLSKKKTKIFKNTRKRNIANIVKEIKMWNEDAG